MSELLFTPDWPLPAGVRSACSLRSGGVSQGVYDSLNLGEHVGDEPSSVATNRRRYAQALSAAPVFLRQVHGTEVALLTAHSESGLVADASVTAQRGLACTIMVADCLPVLFCMRDGSLLGAAHAGWRGLCGEGGRGILETTLSALRAAAADTSRTASTTARADDWLVWLGPCIGPQAFEVGPEVREAFVASDGEAHSCFEPLGQGKFLANLTALARQRLRRQGLTQIYGNDGSAPWCTVGQASRFFSHRRDGVSGRFAASIWIS